MQNQRFPHQKWKQEALKLFLFVDEFTRIVTKGIILADQKKLFRVTFNSHLQKPVTVVTVGFQFNLFKQPCIFVYTLIPNSGDLMQIGVTTRSRNQVPNHFIIIIMLAVPLIIMNMTATDNMG